MESKIDWERVELQFRAGVLSIREIAKNHGISDTIIRRKARNFGWTRDLREQIQVKSERLVSESEAAKRLPDNRSKATDAAIVDANARMIADVKRSHRDDIGRARRLSMKLLDELESQTDNLPLFEQIGEMLRKESDNGADLLNDVCKAVMTLPERTKTMKALSDSLKNLIVLEREAYGISVAQEPPSNPASEASRLSDVERASRAASILAAARARKDAASDGGQEPGGA